jgi:hypothetical protein
VTSQSFSTTTNEQDFFRMADDSNYATKNNKRTVNMSYHAGTAAASGEQQKIIQRLLLSKFPGSSIREDNPVPAHYHHTVYAADEAELEKQSAWTRQQAPKVAP